MLRELFSFTALCGRNSYNYLQNLVLSLLPNGNFSPAIKVLGVTAIELLLLYWK